MNITNTLTTQGQGARQTSGTGSPYMGTMGRTRKLQGNWAQMSLISIQEKWKVNNGGWRNEKPWNG